MLWLLILFGIILLALIVGMIIYVKFHLDRVQNDRRFLTDTFKALSFDVLDAVTRRFLDLASARFENFQTIARGELDKKSESLQQLVGTVKETLNKLGDGIEHFERKRQLDQEGLKTQLNFLIQVDKELRQETAQLSKALRVPFVRGRWGELQLKRVVELAGMLHYCDFYEQTTMHSHSQSMYLRPDLLIRLPGGRHLIVDAKVPLEGYIESLEITEESQRLEKLRQYSKQVRVYVSQLSKKGYWEQLQLTPEFVILFLPSEAFFSAALEGDPTLIEVGAEQGVILATPVTLIALLRTIAYGWKQERLSIHAQEISVLGQELHKRLSDMSDHWTKIGRGLTQAVDSYNKAVGSWENRVLVTARKLKDCGAGSSHVELTRPDPIDREVRVPSEN